jgi:glycosyltransferase involved in cell wall biosynthesis
MDSGAPGAHPIFIMKSPTHVAVAIMLPYRREGDFWGRDAGLLTRGFEELGVRSTLVALDPGTSDPVPSGSTNGRMVLTGPAQLASAAWWRSLRADLVVLFGWTLPRFEPVRSAIREVTPRLVERMDTDGMRAAWLDPRLFLYLSWAQAMDRLGARSPWSWKSLPAGVAGAAWTLRSLLGGSTIGRRDARVVAGIPSVLVESEVAAGRIRRWLAGYGHRAGNIHVVPHAVHVAGLPAPDESKKKPARIVSVGRWRSFQKNYECTLRLAREFLRASPDHEFVFAGECPPKAGGGPGIIHWGHKSRGELGALMLDSRVLFSASRYESFHLSAAEALCCGCTIVMNDSCPTAPLFAALGGGTVASGTGRHDLLRALLEDAGKWKRGEYDPVEISARCRNFFSPESVARQILDLPF